MALWNGTYLESVSALPPTTIVKGSKSTDACLIDELKPVFGLTKMGTHHSRLKGKTIILSQPVVGSSPTQEEIRQIMLMGDVLSLRIYEKDMYGLDGRPGFQSCVTLNPQNKNGLFKTKVIKYFGDYGKYRQFCSAFFRDRPTLLEEMEAVIDRVNRDKIWILNVVGSRLEEYREK